MCHGGDPSKKVFHVLLLFMCYHDLFAHQLLRTAQAPWSFSPSCPSWAAWRLRRCRTSCCCRCRSSKPSFRPSGRWFRSCRKSAGCRLRRVKLGRCRMLSKLKIRLKSFECVWRHYHLESQICVLFNRVVTVTYGMFYWSTEACYCTVYSLISHCDIVGIDMDLPSSLVASSAEMEISWSLFLPRLFTALRDYVA